MAFCNHVSPKMAIKKKRSSVFKSAKLFDLNYIAPNTMEEIALHPKKLNELMQWFRSKMSFGRGAKTLLLTGPSGSGKRTAVKLLSAELGIEVTEWEWSDEHYFYSSTNGSSVDDALLNNNNFKRRSSSPSNGFVHFLQDTEFCSIQRMSLKHRLLLISQLPSLFLREPKKLHELLTSVIPRSRCIIVFVLPNVDSCWSLSPYRIFPHSVLEALGITHIKFNAISTSIMTNALRRASQKIGLSNFNKNLNVRSIADSSFGDIRRAMNSLLIQQQQQKNAERTSSSSSKRSRLENSANSRKSSALFTTSNLPSSSSSSFCGVFPIRSGPDQLEIFHFIGKMMYAKRAEQTYRSWEETEAKLGESARKWHARPFPPKDDLNFLVEISPLPAQLLASYLFEHEPRFGPSIRAVAKVQQIVSQLDLLVAGNFEQRNLMEKYMLDLSVRASLFHNYRPATPGDKQKWRFYQFEKPRLYDLAMQRMETKSRIAALYPVGRTKETSTLLLPLMPRIPSICVGYSHAELLERLSFSSSNLFRLKVVGDENCSPFPTILQQQQTSSSNCCCLTDSADLEELSELTASLFEPEQQILQQQQSPNASFNSFYSISSQQTDRGGEEEEGGGDGFSYDIEEVEAAMNGEEDDVDWW